MSFFANRTEGAAGSFLPEDYLVKKAERRSVLISLFLFVVVALGVVGAFLVTNRQWNGVRTRQEEINREYAIETAKIDQLKQLEQQKSEMLQKAEITTALIEKVPRSIMLAELINRMPKQMTMTELNMKSTRVVEAAKPVPQNQLGTVTAQSLAAQGPKPVEPPKPMPPKFVFKIELTGLSASDDDIADYHSALLQCPLLDQVEMLSSVEIIVDEVSMRKFRIDATIKASADARNIEPLHVPRLGPRPDSATTEARASSPEGAKGTKPRQTSLKPKVNPMDPTLPREEQPAALNDQPGAPAHTSVNTETEKHQ